MSSLLRAAVLAIGLMLGAAAPVLAQEVSADDRATVTARFETLHDEVVGGDMSAAMDMLPPGVIDAMAARYGVTPEQAREAAREVAAEVMSGVEIVDYRIDMDGAQAMRTPDGARTYLIVPLHMTMRLQGMTVKATSPTLTFEVDDVWYMMNVDEAEQAAVLAEVYPEFRGVDFPKGTMEIVED
ncbi:MAG TPA: hypothetical protein VGR32_10410 [Brevundimonas sp.]|uniref:hypothetical protein n=1 Tax=Brevundimonas sp. TaxID=1871086 RepID=UPI002DE517F9|nr:hypothetical protein [Brevundimonas sp.]